MASVRLDGLSKTYPGQATALHPISLEADSGEFVLLAGPANAGKSTVLRLIAGLDEPTGGSLYIDDRLVVATPPRHRGVGMVFEGGALYPHLTIQRTMALALRLAKLSRVDTQARVQEVAQLLEIEHLLDRRPRELSAMESALAALGRAAVRRPGVLLLDDPTDRLDAPARRRVQAAIRGVHQDLGPAVLYATRALSHVMTLGGRVAIMDAGILQQCASPIEIYARPANLMVAVFAGDPPMNLIEGALRGEGERIVFESPALQVELPQIVWTGLRAPQHGEVVLGVRPEHLRAVHSGSRAGLAGRVASVEPLGNETIAHVSADGIAIVVRLHRDILPRVGDALELGFDIDRAHFFDRQTGQNLLA